MNKKLIVIISLFLIGIVVGSILAHDYLESEERKEEIEEERDRCYREMWEAEARWIQEQYSLYENYSRDSDMLSLFFNITVIHPFLKTQMVHLREYMDALVDNTTKVNFRTARGQYLLCERLNGGYMENYTAYFTIKEERYDIHMIFDDVAYRYRDDGDDDHDEGMEAGYYTDDLKLFGSQLDYIKGVKKW